MVNLTINGKKVQAQKGEMLLQVCRDNGFNIPTLCHNDAVEPDGRCRLCSVEVTEGNSPRIVVSCHFPVKDGIDVQTASPRVMAVRKLVMELLAARCPDKPQITGFARTFGVTEPRYKPSYDDDCILCGLCARVCSEVVGVNALSLVNRGSTKWAATPFYEASKDCIGCGSCAYVCPTDCIGMEQEGDRRFFRKWKTEFKMKSCPVCGEYWAPEYLLEYIQKK
ncbi:MAG: 2Fe-2S iron-sulfur cluster-binding protein, partial [Dehalococcoidia bacterium]|nr:2Fe-2S iron-sulfur cluster-binding protein [Dehalococcoidia bacterium]